MQNEYINFYSNNSGQLLLFPVSGYFTGANVYPIFFNFKDSSDGDGILSYFGFEQRNAFVFGNLILFESSKKRMIQILDSKLDSDKLYKVGNLSNHNFSLKIKGCRKNSPFINITITRQGIKYNKEIFTNIIKSNDVWVFEEISSHRMRDIEVVFVQQLSSKIKLVFQQFTQCLCYLITKRIVLIHSSNIEDARRLSPNDILVNLTQNLDRLSNSELILLYSTMASRERDVNVFYSLSVDKQKIMELIFNQILTFKDSAKEVISTSEVKLLVSGNKKINQLWSNIAEYVFNIQLDETYLTESKDRNIHSDKNMTNVARRVSEILYSNSTQHSTIEEKEILTFISELISTQGKEFIKSSLSNTDGGYNKKLFVSCMKYHLQNTIQDMVQNSIVTNTQNSDSIESTFVSALSLKLNQEILNTSYINYVEEVRAQIISDITEVYLTTIQVDLTDLFNLENTSHRDIYEIIQCFNISVLNTITQEIANLVKNHWLSETRTNLVNTVFNFLSEISEQELESSFHEKLIDDGYLEMLASTIVETCGTIKSIVDTSTLHSSSSPDPELYVPEHSISTKKPEVDSTINERIKAVSKNDTISQVAVKLKDISKSFIESVISTNLVNFHPMHTENFVFRELSKSYAKVEKPFDTDYLYSFTKLKTNVFRMLKQPRAVRKFLSAMTNDLKLGSVKIGEESQVMVRFLESERNSKHSGTYMEPWILASKSEGKEVHTLFVFVYTDKEKKFYYNTGILMDRKEKIIDVYRKQVGDYVPKPFGWESSRKIKGVKDDKDTHLDFLVDIERLEKQINLGETKFSEKLIKDLMVNLFDYAIKEKDFSLIEDFNNESDKLKESYTDQGILVNGGTAGTERIIFNEIITILLEMYGRWYHLPSDGPYDEMIVPQSDYPYSQFPVNGRSVHPMENGKDIGTTEIAVSIQIMANTLDFLNEVYLSYYQFYNNCIPEQSLKHFVMQVHDWVTLYLPDNVDKIPEYYPSDYEMYNNDKYSLEDYERLYRWIRWYAEGMIGKIDSSDKSSLTGHKYVKMLITELETYFNNHHGVYGVPGKKKFDKKKGVRHKILSKFGILRDTHGSFGGSHKYLPKNDEYTRKQWKKGDSV